MSLRPRHRPRVMFRIARRCSGDGWPAQVCAKCVYENAHRIWPRLWAEYGWVPLFNRDAMVYRPGGAREPTP